MRCFLLRRERGKLMILSWQSLVVDRCQTCSMEVNESSVKHYDDEGTQEGTTER